MPHCMFNIHVCRSYYKASKKRKRIT